MESASSARTARSARVCAIASTGAQERDERLVVCVTAHASVILNRYPFASGHLLILPHEHVSGLELLSAEAHDGLFALVREATVRLKQA